MATIKQVARLAEVSVATVSRVLNGVRVSDANHASVVGAIEQLDYRPNAFARSLATNRSGGVGVVVNEISSPYYSGIVQGIESVVEEHGMHLIVSSSHAKADRERNAVEFLRERRCEALILMSEALSDAELLRLARHETPTVLVGRSIDDLAENCVHIDNVLGGYTATHHLISRGHSRIAHVTGNLAIKDARDRLVGYHRALADAGIGTTPELVVEGDFTEAGGRHAIRMLLERGESFSAVFAANDQTAAGVLLTLRENGLSCPDDVSIVGYDDVLLANYLYPALTTVRQPFVEMGKAAARLALATETKEVTRRFEPTLVPRHSVSTRA
ncbi:MAG: LacI family DNA-binding transcriptional regulator [Trueperaceae bacterium]|nr:LacI family DNA-binding transcriptional regulator [Trueperaceae bacterium]